MQTLEDLALSLSALGFRRVSYIELHCYQHGDIRGVIEDLPAAKHPCPICQVPGACVAIGAGFTKREVPIFHVVCYPTLDARRRFRRVRRVAAASLA